MAKCAINRWGKGKLSARYRCCQARADDGTVLGISLASFFTRSLVFRWSLAIALSHIGELFIFATTDKLSMVART
jgi:hypothetical protein